MKKIKGFTLIELMIVVAIVSILAAFALPAYNESVKKSKRRIAQGDLTELAQYMERYFTENNKYLSASLPFTESPQDGGSKFYDLSLATPTTTTSYTLTAAPKNGQESDSCGTLTLTNTGLKGPTTSGCW